MSERLDAALVSRGLCGGRDKAKRLIAEGAVTVGGKIVTKASFTVSADDEIVCSVKERFVGRGGEKLLKVLEETALDVRGKTCVDIGASTGGFTDCLLQHGAEKVFAVDVGRDQLAPSLRADARVVCMESTDIRDAEAVGRLIPAGEADVCTVDVSFISLTQIWDSAAALLRENGAAVVLIKPQFEAGRAALSKRGVVRNAKDHVRVLQTLLRFWQEKHAAVSYLSWSPVRGGEGNIEYIALLHPNGAHGMTVDPSAVVASAFDALRAE